MGRDPETIRSCALGAALRTPPVEAVAARPPLADLLAAPLPAGRPVLFSLQRVDRRWPGLAVLRGADGRFVRDRRGELLHLPQLALSSTGLPGTISLGNTPQGVFAVCGIEAADNPFIGPSPCLVAKLPIEATPIEFLHGAAGAPASWTEAAYAELLPASWRGYRPMFEAWLAGRAGRSEILAHGTTIDPEFTAAQPFYPLTPSAGCVTTIELWSPVDGSLVRSDQQVLVRAFEAAGGPLGFLVVVDIDARPAPVTLADVRSALM
ncbi:MAG: hypothetical protein IPM29_26450 [Planctomycetes bacterium]|nr:hypothetical protein [Planctomycetota bacterium]